MPMNGWEEEKGDYSRIHPNDHVNMAQSTNDVIPTAGKLTVLELLKPLLAELDGLERELRIKAAEFDGILKMGRTQLQDAVPMRLGQTFHAYATMVKRDYERLKEVRCEMFTVNLGEPQLELPSMFLRHIYLTWCRHWQR